MSLNIVADENIPLVEEYFSNFGDLTLLPGRTMSARDLKKADVLLVRSVTQVNQALLQDSKVAFVGSATIGVDHVDTSYLIKRGIHFQNAPGCNANSVVEYVTVALVEMAERQGKSLKQQSLGVIGYGNVGKMVAKKLSPLVSGIKVYDPLLTEEAKRSIPSSVTLVELEEVLSVDIICCHTPFTQSGPFPTKGMLDEKALLQLRDDCVLLNAGRGGVINENHLLAVLSSGKPLNLVLDVWEGEPVINQKLISKVQIATPHVAGYSWEGKTNGTRMIYEAFNEWLKKQGHESQKHKDIPAAFESLTLTLKGAELEQKALLEVCRQVYDIRKDDQQLRETMQMVNKEERGKAFDRLRKEYGKRRSFSDVAIEAPALNQADRNCLIQLGFKL